MQINLMPILNGTKKAIDVHCEIEVPAAYFQNEDVVFEKPVKVSGTIENLDDCIVLNLSVSGTIKTCCARCLKELSLPLEFSLDNMIASKDTEKQGEENMIVLTGHSIDLTDLILSTVGLNLQTKYLCDENCKGICPKCGADLNLTQCKCSDEEIDDRLKILKSYFNE